MASFSVSIMARESRSVLERVARHYHRLGALQIILFCDSDAAEIAALDLPGLGIPGLEPVPLDGAFWYAHLGRRPQNFTEKQRVTNAVGLQMCRADWLLIVDTDEFVVCERPFADLLADLPDGLDVLRLPNVEAVWGPGDPFGSEFGSTHFRRPCSGRLAKAFFWLVYGRDRRLLQNGLAGHASGKQVLRKAASYDLIDPHVTLRGGREIGRWLADVLPGEAAFVAHFDAVSVARWSEKFRRRYAGEASLEQLRSSRLEQVELARIAADGSADAVTGLCRRLHGLSALQYRLLAAAGLAFRRRIFS